MAASRPLLALRLALVLLLPLLCTGLGISLTSRPQANVWVGVFSRRDHFERRASIREMWANVQRSGNATARFLVCGRGKGSEQNHSLLADEMRRYADIIKLDCDEGYSKGALTRKTLAAMKHFVKHRRDEEYFFKVDDDTYVNWGLYARQLARRGSDHLYMGIPVGESAPCRNVDFLWYEPYDTFPGTLFPKGMAGGPGYTISKDLVELVVRSGIGDEHILYNEDRAVAVWMDLIKKNGQPVDFASLRGVDGFWAWNWKTPLDNWRLWRDYPHVLHHGLQGASIACLAEAERANDPDRNIRHCFDSEVGRSYKPLKCAQLNLVAQRAKLLKRTA